MTIKRILEMRLMAAILMLLASTMPLFAQQPTLDKNDEGYYMIKSAEDYEKFRQIVATGNPYANAVLTQDIRVCHPIGDGEEQFHYRGTFDGQGHTVTLKGESDNDASSGMFAFTKPGCVIRNLILHGILDPINESEGYYGALVNDATGTIIENCLSQVILYGRDGSGKYLGGFVGVSRGKCFIENCGYAGQMLLGNTLFGFVAHNSQNLSIKNCYSVPGYNSVETSFDSNASFFTDKMDKGDICLNNYYFTEKGIENKIEGCNELNGEKNLSNLNRLGWQINRTGKNGVVWYQDSYDAYFPRPFKGSDSRLIVSHDDGATLEYLDNCSHSYSDHICSYCGDIEPGSKIEPLQNHDERQHIDNIIFGSETERETGKLVATVTGIESDAKAVHIPATINIKGEEYPVRAIISGAFANSKIEYIYIPNTVNNIYEDFKGCDSLKYVHIADGSEKIGIRTFTDSPLENVYIGRNLVINDHDGPFAKASEQTFHLFWGPRTTIVGNADEDRKDLTCKFSGELGSSVVFFLGDEKSENLNVTGNSDLSTIPMHCYINRNITGNLSSENRTGLFDFCVKAVYGPFVKTIAEKSFLSKEGNKELLIVDFSNAYNLETIGDSAFAGCSHWGVDLDFSTMNVKNLGKNSFAESHIRSVVFNQQMQTIPSNIFANCKKLRKVYVSSSITSIEPGAFKGCEGLSVYFEKSDSPLSLNEGVFDGSTIDAVYFDRNITDGDTSSSPRKLGVVTIGPNATDLDKKFFDGQYCEAFVLENSDKPLHFDDYFNGGATTLVLNRDIVCDKDGKYALPFVAKDSTNSVTFGDKLNKIYANVFNGYKELQYVILPSNITVVDYSAFKDCKNLEVVSILGEPNLKNEVFSGCEKLKYLFFMGNSVELGNNVFKDCPLIEVTTNFDSDPRFDSPGDAFDNDTYYDAQLINIKNAEFTSDPWVRFHSVRTNDTNISVDAVSGENFDRAYIHHKFPAGEFDMVYLPFDMDSYYFGIDAEIYRLDISDEETGNYNQNITTPLDRGPAFSTHDINFVKVDIDNEKRLKKGNVYFIKINHDEESMAAYFSFFEGNGVKVVNTKTLLPKEDVATSEFKVKEWDSTQDFTSNEDYNYYTFSEGVLKQINGEYHPARGTALLLGGKKGAKAFKLNNGDATITSSVSDVAFNEKLEGYSSFYAADYNYIAPDWIDVYIVTSIDGTTINMEKVEDRTITKGQAVLLKSSNDVKVDGGITEYLTYATHGSSASYDNNILKGVNEDTPANELSSEGFVYVLSCNQAGNNTGFYKLSGDRIMPTGKAYLCPNGLSPKLLAKACLFVVNEYSTDIKSAPVMDREQRIYDLMGRRLKDAGFKGIYIINGKKVINK